VLFSHVVDVPLQVQSTNTGVVDGVIDGVGVGDDGGTGLESGWTLNTLCHTGIVRLLRPFVAGLSLFK
jgi:hypothetical protein